MHYNFLCIFTSQRDKLKRAMKNPWSAQAAEAWMKLANDNGKFCLQSIMYQKGQQIRGKQDIEL